MNFYPSSGLADIELLKELGSCDLVDVINEEEVGNVPDFESPGVMALIHSVFLLRLGVDEGRASVLTSVHVPGVHYAQTHLLGPVEIAVVNKHVRFSFSKHD